ncbi:GNAT family N-acetyltransferase [Magnetospirillum sp. 64-120]|uniref:GNAT family N-acetyltransferase n=1 Tax=Magnetospirillum sp. 64-120 TaxID=1895778 RepID=UPI000927B1FD|nr:GNAT family N-acetyltransferase [Magnetospirillum sp. 64-120]OJX75198.1 MAG: GNAT family N-acetyltransferase [Magnetospirillum sp. 64-120]
MSDTLEAQIVGSLDAIPAADWNACAGTGNPFVRHGFLAAIENSRSAAGETGWLPRHAVIKNDDGEIVAVSPLYVKSHSYGEYVFDWGWAEAYARAGGRYYPKLQCAVPFTPVAGPRLLSRHNDDRHRLALGQTMAQLAEQAGLSSVHVTFCDETEASLLENQGFLRRLGSQYHWENRGYDRFDDFLEQLTSRKRKQVKKERQAVAVQNLSITTLVGADVKARHWDYFHRFYESVVDRKWGSAYLNREFFDLLSMSEVADDVVLVWVEQDGEPLAAAFNMLGADTLYGRTWGVRPGAETPFLHFEACYYRAIDFAIAHNLARVEAGAQGEHKVARGYLPRPTHSAHWIKDLGLRQAVAKFLAHERALLAEDMAETEAAGPFSQKSIPPL